MKRATTGRIFPIAVLALFIVSAVHVWRFSSFAKVFSEELLIHDQIWLDYLAILTFVLIAVLWFGKFKPRLISFVLVACLSIYGIVLVSILLDGTAFSMNGYWGDQKFRMAMISRIAEDGWISDMYYHGLSSFYPPLYYAIVAIFNSLLNWPSFFALKLGNLMTYIAAPWLFFLTWRWLVGNRRAFWITLFTILISTASKEIPFNAPHAFLGNGLFIPWWLIFIEQCRKPRKLPLFIVIGGLLGAACFATYFYPFIVTAPIILIYSIRGLARISHRSRSLPRLSVMWLVIAASALLSSPYWLPVMWEVIEFGMDRTRGGWHHAGSTGLSFPFISFSLIGIAFAAAILYFVRRVRRSPYRQMLFLLGGSIGFFLLAAFSGAVDHPLNLIKIGEFLIILSGAFVGLAAADLLQFSQKSRRTRLVGPAFIGILLLYLLSQPGSTIIRSTFDRTARTAQIPQWPLITKNLDDYKSRIFLTDSEELLSFYPVHSFIAHNEHYSNPAARFIQRFEMLHLLQRIHDPALFNLALRHNRYDLVEYFMPAYDAKGFGLTISVSNYPNRHITHKLKFDTTLVADNERFEAIQPNYLYKILPAANDTGVPFSIGTPDNHLDSMFAVGTIHNLGRYLDSDTRKRFTGSIPTLGYDWKELTPTNWPQSFADSAILLSVLAAQSADTVELVMLFRANRTFHDELYISVEPVSNEGREPQKRWQAYLRAEKSIRSWQTGDLVFCHAAIPKAKLNEPFMITFGGQYGPFAEPFRLELSTLE